MKVKVHEETNITLTEDDVEKIIIGYLKDRGYEVNRIDWNLNREYSDYDDSYGTMVFNGAKIKANSKETKKEL